MAQLEVEAADGRWSHDPLARRVRKALPLIAMWGRREYHIRYRQSALGVAWGVAQPAALLLTYGVVLSLVFKVPSEGLPYISMAYAGLVSWTFVANAISAGFPSMMAALPLISKVYFPREFVSLAVTASAGVDLAIGTTVLLVLVVVQDVGLGVTALALIPIDLILVVDVAAVAVVGSAVTVFVRDVRHVLPVALQVVFFASPVMYPASLVPSSWRWVNSVNPIAVVTEATRDAVLRHQWPNWPLLGVHAITAVALLVLAIAYVRSVEPRLVDVA